MADAANEVAWRLQRALLAYVRQEFSSPAAAIYGYAELMLEDAASRGPREVLDDLERIRQAGADLHALIEGLLDPAAIAHRAAQSDFAGFRRRLEQAFGSRAEIAVRHRRTGRFYFARNRRRRRRTAPAAGSLGGTRRSGAAHHPIDGRIDSRQSPSTQPHPDSGRYRRQS